MAEEKAIKEDKSWIKGEETFTCGGEQLPISKGNTIFVSVGIELYMLSGKVEYLDICF